MTTSKAKKAAKKPAGMKRGKTLQAVKPLTKTEWPAESISFNYGGPVVVYTPQKG